jgi:long-chain acyl-CoA synthetase
MHMNSAIAAGALQVLCHGPDFADAVATAHRHAATHLYSLPVRLIRGAENLSGLRLPPGCAIGSGGSALPARVARKLSEHFDVPVFQGYGLAETSPLTHSEGPEQPAPGSVGHPVPGTECRIVDLDSGAPLGPDGVGEVQVRGPQVMLGYLRADGTLDRTGIIDADGWLSTGDVGRLDPAGRLFLVDRIKDVFKCDNWLVAPSEIEAVAEGHPAVREAVAFDVPDEFSGAVAAAYVVLTGGDAATVESYVNDRVPYYQRLRRTVAVDAIPRSPNGKVQRRELRYAMIAGRKPELPAQLTVVNTFTVRDPADVPEFEGRFLAHVQYMRAQDGFVGHQLLRYADEPGTYVNVGWWRRPDDFQAVLAGEVFREHAKQFGRLVEVQAQPSRSLPAVRGLDRLGRESTQYPVVVLECFTVTGDVDRFTAAFAGYAAGVPTEDLSWIDLAAGLRAPLSYTAVSRWVSVPAYERARSGPAYQAVLEHADVTAHPGASVAASRSGPAVVEPASTVPAQV